MPQGSLGGLAMTFLAYLLSTYCKYIFLVACLHQVVLVLVFERRLKTVQKTLATKLSTQEWRTFLWTNVWSRWNQIKSLVNWEKICALLSRDRLRLTKWLCNRRDVLETIPTSDRASSILDLDLNSDSPLIERTLDVQWTWNMDSDMFTIKMIPKDKLFTRRGILSVTSSIYNPLTMVSPITLQAEKLPQDLCKQGLIWDERIRRDKSQFLENESDVTRRILVKIRQDSVLVRLHSPPPIYQERRQTILHVCGQSPGSDIRWLKTFSAKPRANQGKGVF